MKLKSLIMVILGLSLLGFVSAPVSASEGIFELGSLNGSGSSCYVLSVLTERQYQILGTCRNLKVPYTAELTRYVVWAVDQEGNNIRVGEIKHGKISSAISEKFNSLMVSVETGAQPRRPSENIVARGDLKGIPILGESTPGNNNPTPTPTPVTPEEKPQGRSTLTRFLATVGRIVGIGFLILLIAVVVMTIVTRRKERS